jgi:hypothetical protein
MRFTSAFPIPKSTVRMSQPATVITCAYRPITSAPNSRAK